MATGTTAAKTVRNERGQIVVGAEYFQAILDIDPNKITSATIGTRHAPLTEQAQAIRDLLKVLGIKSVSVRTPNYSMAHAVDVILPQLNVDVHVYGDGRTHLQHQSDPDPRESDAFRPRSEWFDHNMQTCRPCKLRWLAIQHVGKLILTAYPDLDDRSEPNTDYFDYCFHVN